MRRSRTRRLAAFALLLSIVETSPVDAAEADAWLGEWEQVATNAGTCPTCRITVEVVGSVTSVTANNGWAAVLTGIHGETFVGSGQWKTGSTAWVAGRPFDIHIRLEGERLVMTMTVEIGADRTRVVRAAYRRVWQGV